MLRGAITARKERRRNKQKLKAEGTLLFFLLFFPPPPSPRVDVHCFLPLELLFVLAGLPGLSLGPHSLLAMCGVVLLLCVVHFLVSVASAELYSGDPAVR